MYVLVGISMNSNIEYRKWTSEEAITYLLHGTAQGCTKVEISPAPSSLERTNLKFETVFRSELIHLFRMNQ